MVFQFFRFFLNEKIGSNKKTPPGNKARGTNPTSRKEKMKKSGCKHAGKKSGKATPPKMPFDKKSYGEKKAKKKS